MMLRASGVVPPIVLPMAPLISTPASWREFWAVLGSISGEETIAVVPNMSSPIVAGHHVSRGLLSEDVDARRVVPGDGVACPARGADADDVILGVVDEDADVVGHGAVAALVGADQVVLDLSVRGS